MPNAPQASDAPISSGKLVAFELFLAVGGVVLGWPLGLRHEHWRQQFHFSGSSLAFGSLAGFGVAWGLLAIDPLIRWQVWRRLADGSRTLIRSIFRNTNTWMLLAIAISAGVGEEVLFRGAIQPLAIKFFGVVPGIAIAVVAFGAVHCLSLSYAVGATLAGLLLGWWAWAEQGLLAVIAAHAVYDFWLLRCMLARPASHQNLRSGDIPPQTPTI